MPTPAPRYRNAAIIIGDTWRSNIFDIGMLMAYSAAASMAKNIAHRYCVFFVSIIWLQN
jgi:hypothetical protein